MNPEFARWQRLPDLDVQATMPTELQDNETFVVAMSAAASSGVARSAAADREADRKNWQPENAPHLNRKLP